MNDELKTEYQELVNDVQEKLRKSESDWIPQFCGYAKKLTDETRKKKYKDAWGMFILRHPLYAYLTIGKISKLAETAEPMFNIRYLGQSVGNVSVDDADNVKLTVDEKTADRNRNSFNCPIGSFSEEWNGTNASKFRSYFINFLPNHKENIHVRFKEHMLESALYSELEKKSGKGKTLKWIQPIAYDGIRFHMKTAVAASKTGNISYSENGGEIDCLCRIKRGRADNYHLAAIEIKDKNEKAESFDIAMRQAIAYAVFLRELLRSDAGEDWKKVLGMENQYKNNIAIDAVVAMPKKGETEPSYRGDKLDFCDNTGDFIKLHYIKITSVDSEGVKFETSYS